MMGSWRAQQRKIDNLNLALSLGTELMVRGPDCTGLMNLNGKLQGCPRGLAKAITHFQSHVLNMRY